MLQALTQNRYDSPLWQQPRQRRAAHVGEMSDADLHAYCDKHLSDEALEAAMVPITPWCDSQASPNWELIAEHLNAYLGDSWPAPPWNGDQAATPPMADATGLWLEAAGRVPLLTHGEELDLGRLIQNKFYRTRECRAYPLSANIVNSYIPFSWC